MLCSSLLVDIGRLSREKIAIKSVFFQNEATSLLILSHTPTFSMYQRHRNQCSNISVVCYNVYVCRSHFRCVEHISHGVFHGIRCSVCLLHVPSNICENIHAYFLLYNKFKLILRSAALKHLPS